MKIENYEGVADTFNFPHNPNSYDETIDPNPEITAIPYRSYHIAVSGGGIAPKSIVFTGHMDGANRLADYRNLARHFQETNKLKKLFFESDKFNLGIGKQTKKTHSGGRTQFVDYVATFQTIIGILFDNTQQTGGTNDGDVTTFVEQITADYDGTGDVVASDGLGNSWTLPASVFSGTESIVMKFVSMIDTGSGVSVSKFRFVTIAGTQTNLVQTTTGDGMLRLAAAANISTVTVTNVTSLVKTFRNGWSA